MKYWRNWWHILTINVSSYSQEHIQYLVDYTYKNFNTGLEAWYLYHIICVTSFMLYSGDLKSDLVWISNGPKQVGLQMVWISNGIWNPEAQPFEIRTNGRHFVKNHLKSGQKRPDFEWLIAKARPFENRTIWNPTFKKSGFQMFPDFKWSDFRSPLYLKPCLRYCHAKYRHFHQSQTICHFL